MVNTTAAGVNRAAPQGGGLQLSALNHITSVCRSLESSLLAFRFDVLGDFIPIRRRPGSSSLAFDGAWYWLFNYGIGVQADDRESRPPIDPNVNNIPFTEICMQGFDNGLPPVLAPPTTPQGNCNSDDISLADLVAATFQADENSTLMDLDDASFTDMEVAAFRGDINDDEVISADSEATTFHDLDATFQDLEATTFEGDDDDAAFQGEGITVSDALLGSWLAQLEKEMREFLRSLVPGALLSRNQVISRLFWLGLLTLFSALKVVLYVPAAGPVFGRYKTGYYIILAVMLVAAVVELAASYWLSRSKGRAALAFANIVLQTAFPILLFVGTVGHFSIPFATIESVF